MPTPSFSSLLDEAEALLSKYKTPAAVPAVPSLLDEAEQLLSKYKPVSPSVSAPAAPDLGSPFQVPDYRPAQVTPAPAAPDLRSPLRVPNYLTDPLAHRRFDYDPATGDFSEPLTSPAPPAMPTQPLLDYGEQIARPVWDAGVSTISQGVQQIVERDPLGRTLLGTADTVRKANVPGALSYGTGQ